MIDCEKFQDLLLGKAPAAALDAREAEHAQNCPGCAAFLADLQMIEAALEEPDEAAPPAHIRSGLMAEFDRLYPVRQTAPDPGSVFSKMISSFSLPRLVFAGSAVAVLHCGRM